MRKILPALAALFTAFPITAFASEGEMLTTVSDIAKTGDIIPYVAAAAIAAAVALVIIISRKRS